MNSRDISTFKKKKKNHLYLRDMLESLTDVNSESRLTLQEDEEITFWYRPFHKTLPRSSAFVNYISVRFYEWQTNIFINYLMDTT